MAEFAEAHDVDHHVFLELHAVLQRNLCCQHYRLRVVAVDVQHRCLDHFYNVGAIDGRAGIARITGGKADLVVDHDMHRAARAVAPCFGQRQRLHHHALTGKSRISVHQNWQHLQALGVGATVHAGAHGPFHDGIDDFKVRGVESQAQMHRATRRGHIRAEALVILDITAGQVFWRCVIKLGKQIGRHLAQGVDQHIQASAVRHTDHDFLQADSAAALNQLIHRSDKTLATLERKTFLPDVLGMQKALQSFGRRQTIKDVLLLFRTEIGFGANALELLLPPALLILVGDVHVLGTDGAAVGLTQRVHQLAQTHRLFAKEGVAGVEHGFLIGVAETVERGIELRNLVALGPFQGVQIGPARAHRAVGRNQLLCRRSLAPHFGVTAGQHDPGSAMLGTIGKSVDDGKVGHILAAAAIERRDMLQGIKIVAPAVGHTARVGQVVFVHFLNVRCVAAKQMGIGLVGLINRRSRPCPLGPGLNHFPLTSVSLQETLAG